MSGITIRFKVPEGSPLEEHLANYASSRARNYELVRLATNALEQSNHSSASVSESPEGQHQTPPKALKSEPPSPVLDASNTKSEVGFADLDLLEIG